VAKEEAVPAERFYIDSSVLLAQLLRETDQQNFISLEGERVTSELTELECRRTLDRIRIQEQIPEEEIAERLAELDLLLKSMRVVHWNATVLKRAKASFPTVVRSLDAVHLSTAERAKCPVFVTRDKQQGIAAKALGMRVSIF